MLYYNTIQLPHLAQLKQGVDKDLMKVLMYADKQKRLFFLNVNNADSRIFDK